MRRTGPGTGADALPINTPTVRKTSFSLARCIDRSNPGGPGSDRGLSRVEAGERSSYFGVGIVAIPDLLPRFFQNSPAEWPDGQFLAELWKNHDSRPKLASMRYAPEALGWVSTQRTEPLPQS